MSEVQGRVLVAGVAHGPALHFTRPISLWGGVDPETGVVMDPRHPQRGECVAGKVVVLPGTIGSSSSSAIMLELLRNSCAPAAMVVQQADAILTLGVVVARELGYPTIPVIEADVRAVLELGGSALEVTVEGVVRPA
jgi:predicted aconitase with swiveling domain